MKTIMFILVGIAGSISVAAEYDCRVQGNFSEVQKVRFTGSVNEKIKVAAGEDYVFYLNINTNNLVELEVFLPSVEMRIYSKGDIEKNAVTLTSWQRQALLEFSCKKIE